MIFTAGSEGVIRVWRVPNFKEIDNDDSFNIRGKNYCLGVFSSHKDTVWQLV